MNGLRKAAVTVAVASGVVLALGGGAAGQTLVAHWEFEDGTGNDTALDSTGNGHTGQLIGMPGDSTNWVSGKVGAGALSFDGSNDKVDVPYAAELNPNQFSFALWVKPDGGTYYRSPLMCRNEPPQSGYNLYETPDNEWRQPFTGCVRRFRNSECLTRKFSSRVLASAGRVPGRFERPPLRDGGRFPGASRRRLRQEASPLEARRCTGPGRRSQTQVRET